MTKIWKGNYTFEDNEELFPFELTVIDINGSFEGSVFDKEHSNLSDEVIHVKGFYEDNFMSFVITYPFHHKFNSEGIVVTDNSKKGTAIYEGYFNEETKIWEGDWEITVRETPDKKNPGSDLHEFLFGTWEMNE